jgi:cellulose biosynthesis protein BcsQ
MAKIDKTNFSKRKHRIISVASTKGGVGKTTICTGLASVLATNYNQSVLLIDADPSGNSTKRLNCDRDQPGLAEFLLDPNVFNEQEVFIDGGKTKVPNLGVLGGSKNLFNHALNSIPDSALKDLLEPSGDTYIIDSSNQSYHLRSLSLIPATHVLAVSDMSDDGFEGAEDTIEFIENINKLKKSGSKIKIIIVFCNVNPKTERFQLRLQEAKQRYQKYPIIVVEREEDLAKAAEVRVPICQWTKGKRKYFESFVNVIEEVFA